VKNYEPASSFGRDVAKEDARRGDEEAAVAFLMARAGAGPALELAIGTGRIALPLAARGIRVDGIDISRAMIEQLRGKPGGDRLSVTVGDLADVGVPGSYPLIYVVWNSFFNLLTQGDQLRCFRNVAKHLTPGGSFIVETYVPSFLHRLRSDQYVEAESIEIDEVRLDVLRHDAATQTLEESHVSLTPAGIRLVPVVQRYAWPSELDLMARLAGLELSARFGGWAGEPFESSSAMQVSVYRPEPQPPEGGNP
jgi:SAM-dependent methyltransferase